MSGRPALTSSVAPVQGRGSFSCKSSLSLRCLTPLKWVKILELGRFATIDSSYLCVDCDPDRDGTLTLDEYLAVVERRFNAANPDKDGTLDAKELNSRAGKALLRLLK